MSSDNSRKRTTEQAKGPDGKEFYVELGKAYELTDGRIGTVKFIGKTYFKAGIEWIGLAITKGEGTKDNNGTVQGVDYFSCKRGAGAFVQLAKIKCPAAGKAGKEVKSNVHKAGASETGKIDYDAAKFKQDDSGGFLGEKTAKMTEIKKGDVAVKDGSIATGRQDYDAYKGDVPLNDGKDFLAEKNEQKEDVQKGDVEKKKGALETGKSDYEVYKGDAPENDGKDFLKSKEKAVSPSPAVDSE